MAIKCFQPYFCSRRQVISGMISAYIAGNYDVSLADISLNKNIEDRFTTSNSELCSRWMSDWMNGRKKPAGALHVARFADPTYFLLKPIAWTPNSDQEEKYKPVVVPVGFVTDFASIPQIFWSALRPDGLYTYAAILHDYLYWVQNLKRSEADEIFKTCMEDFAVDPIVINSIYRTVRIFGGSSWNLNTNLKLSGEKRILTRFPSDPSTRWDEWKKNSLVFE